MAGYVFRIHRLIDDREPVFLDAAQIAKLPVRYSDAELAALLGGGDPSATLTDATPLVADAPSEGPYLLIKW